MTAATLGLIERWMRMLQSRFYRDQANACGFQADQAATPAERRKWLEAERAWRRLAAMPISVFSDAVPEQVWRL